jgi:peptidoglycan hydrolase CwlO-like protein
LFKYNNELSAEIEKLETQIAEYKEECASRMESVWCKKTEVFGNFGETW